MDQSQLREALMDYTEDQIVDNVVRARNSMPILQIDMEQVEAVVKTSLSASTGGGRTSSNSITLDVQMTPVLDEPAVYEAYERFVSLNGGDSVRDSLHFPVPDTKEPHPDDPDGVHMGRKWRGVYYWVPNKYRKEFFKLCLAAGVRRDARNAARKREADGLKEAGDELRRLRLY